MKQLFRLFVVLIILFPFVVLFTLSMGRNWAYPNVLPNVWTLQNWQNIWSLNADLSQSLILSLLLSTGVAAVVTLLSFITAKHLSFSRHKHRWLLLAYFPYVFAPVILGACLQFFFLKLGWSGSVWGVLLAQLFIAYPFGVILFSGFWNEQTRAMEQLTATLGGNSLQTYIKVLLPIAKNALLICFFQTFLISWFEYGLTTIIGVGKVQTLTVKVFQYVNEANIFYAALASCLLIFPPVALLWVNKKFVFLE
jgi:putative spermidine/putrescine transport system permease protein